MNLHSNSQYLCGGGKEREGFRTLPATIFDYFDEAKSIVNNMVLL